MMNKTGDVSNPDIKVFNAKAKGFVKQAEVKARIICPACGRNISIGVSDTCCSYCGHILKGDK